MNHLQMYKQIRQSFSEGGGSYMLQSWCERAILESDLEKCLSDAMQLLAFCKQRVLDEKQLLLIGNSNTLENE